MANLLKKSISMLKKLFFIILFFLFQSIATAQKTIELNKKDRSFELNKEYFTVYEDKTCSLSFEEIQKQRFSNHSSNSFNFSYSESKFWVKLKIQNKADKKWMFRMLGTLLDEIELYQGDSTGSFKKRISGDKYPHSQREFDLPDFAFNLIIPQNQVSEIYFSVKSIDTKQFTVRIEDETHFAENQHLRLTMWYFYFGLISMMFIYNLLLYFSTFDKSFIYYSLYIFCFIMAQMTLLGFGTQQFWGEYLWFPNRMPMFFTTTTGVFALLFALNFLDVEHFAPKSKIYFKIFISINIILGVLSLIKPAAIYNQLSSYLIVIQSIMVIIVGFKILNRGYSPARYYLLSWAALFVALILFALKMNGLLASTMINYTILPLGATIEVVLLSLGLGNKIRVTQQALVQQLTENEQVRSRIARDLHDDLGSTLSSIRILSEFAKNQAASNPIQTEEILKKIVNSSQKLQENLQDIVWTTQSKDNSLNELTTRMRRFGGEVLEAKNMDFRMKIDDKIYELSFSANIQYDIFMIFKEAINNIAKYSEAKKVEVKMYLDNNSLNLEIKDDGIGFDTNSEKEGNGLKNMIKRTENIGGKIEIKSELNKKTEISLKIPF
jgi:signal transduction histidine kinase